MYSDNYINTAMRTSSYKNYADCSVNIKSEYITLNPNNYTKRDKIYDSNNK